LPSLSQRKYVYLVDVESAAYNDKRIAIEGLDGQKKKLKSFWEKFAKVKRPLIFAPRLER